MFNLILGLEYDLRRSERSHVTGHDDIALDATVLKVCTQEYPNSDYKNNLLKERDMSKGCNKEMDGSCGYETERSDMPLAAPEQTHTTRKRK
ncbi:unnamed protein product [Oncorhynchus mykiss]|uniref:Uncharacterized protein n=1 Tax=Oncorhynchus mykiss TaxID=8022 RepID=A0A060XQV5_ONCMY|nr:unnamed protein product [Oncorhynchus mykiss]